MEIINWGLIKHPINWVILFLMVFIAMTALHLGLRHWQNSA
jgi:hypothetical protein